MASGLPLALQRTVKLENWTALKVVTAVSGAAASVAVAGKAA